MHVTSLKQGDSRWGKIKMLPSDLTIAADGCTTTAVCDLSYFYGCPKNPDEVVGQNIFYDAYGRILWDKITFPKFKFVERVRSFDPAVINAAIAAPFDTVLLEVNFGQHWTWCLGKSPFGGYKIADPLYGDISTTARYKQSITGCATFTKS